MEIRIRDEKRKKLKIGDVVEFVSREDPTDTIKAAIIGIEKFPSFKEAFEYYLPHEYGAETDGEWERMYEYYSREEESALGVIGIKIRTETTV